MTYKWYGKNISFDMLWKGSDSMFRNMDGIKEVNDEDSMVGIPKYASVYMFKVKDGKCYLGVPYDEKHLRVNHFTHVGWKTFTSEKERTDALKNIRWMYRIVPGHPGNMYI